MGKLAKRKTGLLGGFELAMKYPNLFKSRYANLQGSNWINSIDPDDKKAFIEIGLQETDHGAKGGHALLKKYGREHLKQMARIGGIVSSIRKQWNKAVERETFLQGGL